MGTPEFAVASLQTLLNSKHEVVGVVTATDKLGGRGGNQLLQSDVKKFALANHLNTLQPEKLRDKTFLKALQDLNADVFIVVAFRMLPEVVWNMPKNGTYNIHGSLLPKYRGAAPINWAIINGEKETGVSFFKLKHEIDTGNVLLQSKIEIENEDDFGTLYYKLEKLGAETLLLGLEMIVNGNESFLIQNESEVCHAPKIFHETCEINFNQASKKVHDFVRGLSPHPTAHFNFFGEEMKIYKSAYEIKAHNYKMGEIIIDGKKSIKITTLDGFLLLLDIKLEGKRRMNVIDFLNGYNPKL